MARIRSIKPELRTDLTVATWPREVRYAFVLLWGYLDDYGRGVDDLRLIVSDLFPLDRDVTERKMERWLTLMCAPSDDGKHGPLCRYEVDGRHYLHAVNWNSHQRPSHPTPSRWPECPEHKGKVAKSSRSAPDSIESTSGNAPTDFVPEQVVRAGRGSREQGAGPASADADRSAGSGNGSPEDHKLTFAGVPMSGRLRKITEQQLVLGESLVDVATAVEEWMRRADAGDDPKPGLLPYLVADAKKARQATDGDTGQDQVLEVEPPVCQHCGMKLWGQGASGRLAWAQHTPGATSAEAERSWWDVVDWSPICESNPLPRGEHEPTGDVAVDVRAAIALTDPRFA